MWFFFDILARIHVVLARVKHAESVEENTILQESVEPQANKERSVYAILINVNVNVTKHRWMHDMLLLSTISTECSQ